jgi:cellulose synthase (UDP-forming)
MPNLELFANAGFPFTRLADLSETDVILPTVPSPDEIALYLNLMSHFGAQTGYPALRVTVSAPNTVIISSRDYLILGTEANQPAFNSLDALLPVTFDAHGVHVKQEQGYLSRMKAAMAQAWSRLLGKAPPQDAPSNGMGIPDALVEEIKSPSSPDRSIVIVELKQDASADDFAAVFAERSQSQDITGPVSLLLNGQFLSYPLNGATYHVGDITRFALMRIWLTRHFLLLLFVVTALSFLAAFWAYEWMSWHARERLKLAQSVTGAD